MVPERLGDFKQDAFGGEVGLVGIGGRGLHFADHGVLGILKGVVDVELTVLGVVWVEGEAEEAFFEFLLNERSVREIEEGNFLGRSAVRGKDRNLAKLLDEEESFGVVGWDGEGDREFEFLVFEGGSDLDLGSGEEGGGGQEEKRKDFHEMIMNERDGESTRIFTKF